MILEEAERLGRPCKMFISQPRRIAVHGLYQRMKSMIGKKVGMLMGGGTRETDSDAQLLYVTTGYLVQKLAHSTSARELSTHTHLIIDEVHERSIDGDLVCWLAKEVLDRYPRLKVILMSATVSVDIYREYFQDLSSSSHNPSHRAIERVFVGSRRHPVETFFAEEIIEQYQSDVMLCKLGGKVINATTKARDGPSYAFITEVNKLAVAMIRKLAQASLQSGSAVLVFVASITDILEISDKFEGDPKYTICPIHSSIPFEEQTLIFEACSPGSIKVILATNAAESSLTIPDVDTVICLGTHKALQYDPRLHVSVLRPAWISKDSATQRAGRTGRVRPGKVFRLYSRELFQAMDPYKTPEIRSKTLEDVILQLRQMLESPHFAGVIPVLENLIEPPDLGNVDMSISHLYSKGLLTQPNDEGYLTGLGRLVASIPVDIGLVNSPTNNSFQKI